MYACKHDYPAGDDGDPGEAVPDFVFTGLHHQAIQIKDRIEFVERAGLPGAHFVGDRSGDCGDERRQQERSRRRAAVYPDLSRRNGDIASLSASRPPTLLCFIALVRPPWSAALDARLE